MYAMKRKPRPVRPFRGLPNKREKSPSQCVYYAVDGCVVVEPIVKTSRTDKERGVANGSDGPVATAAVEEFKSKCNALAEVDAGIRIWNMVDTLWPHNGILAYPEEHKAHGVCVTCRKPPK